jgi:glycosyltransferase involved in cell wall biosynthesis
MKLIIQIPCLNESETLAIALADLPKEVEGFDTVEWLIIDDGSTDNTAEVARQGVAIIRHRSTRSGSGLHVGPEACLRLGRT